MKQNLTLSQNGLDFIKAHEGFSAVVYADAAGHPTIGYGHKLRTGEIFPHRIDEAEATLLLAQDAAFAVDAVNRAVTVELGQAPFDALVSLAFNIGAGNFTGSTLLKLLNADDMAGAARQFPRWDKLRAGAALVASPGLLARRFAEQQMFAAPAHA